MVIWSRRQTIRLGLAGGAMLFLDPARELFGQTPRRPRRGCMLSRTEVARYMQTASEQRVYETGREPMVLSSGDRDFDLALAQTLSMISHELDVLPGFAYYDDYEGANAYATEAVRLKNADGTVLFGKRLLKKLLALRENPDVAVAAVCAHEFAHILQYKRKLDRGLGDGPKVGKRVELQADYFAGFFAGIRKLERPDFPSAAFALTQYNAGDDMINDPDHHGTNDERGAAVSQGFEAAYRQRLSLGDAVDASIAYVTRL
jgi:hypothetical protein